MKVSFDGTVIELNPRDLDGDGVTGGIERVDRLPADTTLVTQPTELGESLKELNLDRIDPGSRMSGIDMRARLHPVEASSVLAIDALVALKVLPVSCLGFSRQKKRLSCSIMGKGREEIVEIVGGKREHDRDSTLGGRIKSMLGFNNGNNEQAR